MSELASFSSTLCFSPSVSACVCGLSVFKHVSRGRWREVEPDMVTEKMEQYSEVERVFAIGWPKEVL